MDVPTTESKEDREALIRSLTDAVINQLHVTLFHFFEIKSKEAERATNKSELVFQEVDALYMEEIATAYALTPEEYCQLHDTVIDFVTKGHRILASQVYRGDSGSHFIMHSVIFTKGDGIPENHPCSRSSVTAGSGFTPWNAYDIMQQTDIVEFSYNLIERVGYTHEAADIVLNEGRYTVQFDLKDMVK